MDRSHLSLQLVWPQAPMHGLVSAPSRDQRLHRPQQVYSAEEQLISLHLELAVVAAWLLLILLVVLVGHV